MPDSNIGSVASRSLRESNRAGRGRSAIRTWRIVRRAQGGSTRGLPVLGLVHRWRRRQRRTEGVPIRPATRATRYRGKAELRPAPSACRHPADREDHSESAFVARAFLRSTFLQIRGSRLSRSSARSPSENSPRRSQSIKRFAARVTSWPLPACSRTEGIVMAREPPTFTILRVLLIPQVGVLKTISIMPAFVRERWDDILQ